MLSMPNCLLYLIHLTVVASAEKLRSFSKLKLIHTYGALSFKLSWVCLHCFRLKASNWVTSTQTILLTPGMCTRPFRPRPRRDPRRKCARPRRDVVSPRQDWDRDVTSCRDVWWKAVSSSPQVAAYRDNWTGIRAKHVAFIIWAFYGLVNAVVGLPYVILVSVV